MRLMGADDKSAGGAEEVRGRGVKEIAVGELFPTMKMERMGGG